VKKIKDMEPKEKAGDLLNEMQACGFQATQLAEAFGLIQEMKKEKATVFLSFTANLVASGLRGIIAEMCRKRFADVIVTTAGSIDHDIVKTLIDYKQGFFDADDVQLHKKGINRIGNIFAENKGFEQFEEKIQPLLEKLHKDSKCISPSQLTRFLGENISDEKSFLKHCSKNKIPVFCPGITDGAIGLQLYFFKQKHKDFCVDVTKDMDELAQKVLTAEKTGAIVLGGGISKHHTIGANLLREGLDYAVYISTATELDGSLSGARTKEAKSWGKLQEKGKSVNVFCDATIALPIIASALKEKKLL
jgi:deoxyhypusine synthase